jgi:uncharacterized protein GlcG (DUF336 family)
MQRMASTITLKSALRMCEAAVDESERRGVLTAVAVVDARGDLIVAMRMDGARHYYPDIAYGKAMGAALWQAPSRELSGRSGNNSVQQRVNSLHGGRIVFAPGAIPLKDNGVVIGAVGVGGSGPDSDEEIAIQVATLLDPR